VFKVFLISISATFEKLCYGLVRKETIKFWSEIYTTGQSNESPFLGIFHPVNVRHETPYLNWRKPMRLL